MRIGVLRLYVTTRRYGRDRCSGVVLCTKLTDNACGDYGIVLSAADTGRYPI